MGRDGRIGREAMPNDERDIERARDVFQFWDAVKSNWAVIAMLVSAVVGWANVQSDIGYLRDQVRLLAEAQKLSDLKIEQFQEDVADISGDIKEIKASISFIRDSISD